MKAAVKKEINALKKFVLQQKPSTFDMGDWAGETEYDGISENGVNCVLTENDGTKVVTLKTVGKCNTTHCLAGWEVLRRGYALNDRGEVFAPITLFGKLTYTPTGYEAPEFAKKTLGLTEKQAAKLFYPESWPTEGNQDEPYNWYNHDSYFNKFPNTPQGAADRLDHFVKTGK